jgi:hypothetical protein
MGKRASPPVSCSCPTLDDVCIPSWLAYRSPSVCVFCRIFTDIICQFRDIKAMRHAGQAPTSYFRLGGRDTDRQHSTLFLSSALLLAGIIAVTSPHVSFGPQNSPISGSVTVPQKALTPRSTPTYLTIDAPISVPTPLECPHSTGIHFPEVILTFYSITLVACLEPTIF